MKILTLKHLWHSRCWMHTYLQTFLLYNFIHFYESFCQKEEITMILKDILHSSLHKRIIFLQNAKLDFFFQKVNTPLKSSLKPGLGGLYCNKVAAKTSFLHLVTGDDFLNLHNSYDTNIITCVTCVTYVWYLNPSL